MVLDALQPVTNFYINNEGFGLTLIALMQIIVDVELVVVIVYWFVYGTNMRYPLVLAIIGVSKILLNVPIARWRCYSRPNSSTTALINGLSLL